MALHAETFEQFDARIRASSSINDAVVQARWGMPELLDTVITDLIRSCWEREQKFKQLKAEYNRALSQLHGLGGCFEPTPEFAEENDDADQEE